MNTIFVQIFIQISVDLNVSIFWYVVESLRETVSGKGLMKVAVKNDREFLPLSKICCPEDPTNTCPAAESCFMAERLQISHILAFCVVMYANIFVGLSEKWIWLHATWLWCAHLRITSLTLQSATFLDKCSFKFIYTGDPSYSTTASCTHAYLVASGT